MHSNRIFDFVELFHKLESRFLSMRSSIQNPGKLFLSFLISCLFTFNQCSPPKLNNLCDSNNNLFSRILLLNSILGESFSFCGYNLTSSNYVSFIYTVGFKRQTAGDTKWWIKKYDENGLEDTENWNKSFDGGNNLSDSAFACAVDTVGNVYVAGRNDSGGGNQNWWIKKYSETGVEDTTNWNKIFDGGNLSNDEAYSIKVDPSDQVWVVGRRHQSITLQDWWIKKFNSNGTEDTVNWNLTFDGPASVTDDAKDVFIDPQGNIYVVGEMETVSGAQDMWIKKFNSTGMEFTSNWNKSYDGGANQNDIFEHVIVDPTGNVFVSGTGRSPTNSEDWWLKKFDLNGNEDLTYWDKKIDGGVASSDILRSMAMDSFGNLYFGGRFNAAGNNPEWSIKKYSSSGIEDTLHWNKRFNADSSNLLDDVFALAVDIKNNVYAAGLCQRTATGEDWCIKKYSSSGQEDTTNWNKVFDGGTNLNENAQGICIHNKRKTP